MQDELERRLDNMESLLLRLTDKVSMLETAMKADLKRYLTTCPVCKREFDLLVNHYSIGLFDNLVHVKCPGCNKSMPLVDRGDGGIRVVLD